MIPTETPDAPPPELLYSRIISPLPRLAPSHSYSTHHTNWPLSQSPLPHFFPPPKSHPVLAQTLPADQLVPTSTVFELPVTASQPPPPALPVYPGQMVNGQEFFTVILAALRRLTDEKNRTKRRETVPAAGLVAMMGFNCWMLNV